jgi:hypothetical protein
MKTKLTLLCTALTLALALNLNAASKAETGKSTTTPSKKTCAEFEQMKTLVGKWTGKADMGQGPVDMLIEYRLLAGGSVLEERSFPGTPHEMVTMYYDLKGKLAMTHYCVLGNRPEMKFKSWDNKTRTMKFDFDPNCGINVKKESHMHALSITFDSADTITTSGIAIMDGKEQPPCATTLKRVKD